MLNHYISQRTLPQMKVLLLCGQNIKKHPFSSERLSGGAYETWLLKSTEITAIVASKQKLHVNRREASDIYMSLLSYCVKIE